jgi:hypothetical protein
VPGSAGAGAGMEASEAIVMWAGSAGLPAAATLL